MGSGGGRGFIDQEKRYFFSWNGDREGGGRGMGKSIPRHSQGKVFDGTNFFVYVLCSMVHIISVAADQNLFFFLLSQIRLLLRRRDSVGRPRGRRMRRCSQLHLGSLRVLPRRQYLGAGAQEPGMLQVSRRSEMSNTKEHLKENTSLFLILDMNLLVFLKIVSGKYFISKRTV